MTKYKAIVLDLDGTLLNTNETISNRNKEFIFEQKEQGVKVILATGRPINMTLPYHEELKLNTPIISLNGAVVYDRLEHKVLNHSSLSPLEVDTVYQLVSSDARLMISHTSKANYQMINIIGKHITENWPIEKEGVKPGDYEPVLKLSVHFKDVTLHLLP